MSSLIISSTCPSCGATLDFREGTNALTCGHCRSNLFVTGRRQVLSYFIAPKLEQKKAVAIATMAQRNRGLKNFRCINPQMYYLPYYRMTGHDFSWEKAPPKPVKEEKERDIYQVDEFETDWNDRWNATYSTDIGSILIDTATDLLERFFGKKDTVNKKNASDDLYLKPVTEEKNQFSEERLHTKGFLYEYGKVFLKDRYIEKSFIAINLHGAGIYSLGVRPSVLKLNLFNRELMGSSCIIVPPIITPEDAEITGTKTSINNDFLCRNIAGKTLSIIYFPFWFIDVESAESSFITIIDALSQQPIRTDASPDIYKNLLIDTGFRHSTISLRPLNCPECGWDLPVRPDDIIFFCKNCLRAWQISSSKLLRVTYNIATIDTNYNTKENIRYLPFWILQCNEEGIERRYFIPAFKYRRLNILIDLALKITRMQPEYNIETELRSGDLYGCYYDMEDAITIAIFVRKALIAEKVEEFKDIQREDITPANGVLTWVPFKQHGGHLYFGDITIPLGLFS